MVSFKYGHYADAFMFKDTYTKFYIFIIASLILSFVFMEVVTSGATLGELTGMATQTIQGAEPVLGPGTPGSNLLFLLIGVVVGAIIVGTAIYIYKYEKKRMY